MRTLPRFSRRLVTGYDPLLDNTPELARTMAASVTQRIACGERVGGRVRRIGAGFGEEAERPERTGPRCASAYGFPLPANTKIPAHRRDQLECLIRYTGRDAVLSGVIDKLHRNYTAFVQLRDLYGP
jgi:hypothetical protein